MIYRGNDLVKEAQLWTIYMVQGEEKDHMHKGILSRISL